MAGALFAVTLSLAFISGSVLRDGQLPAHPYRYLHPPPALAAGNHRPASARANLPVTNGEVQYSALFTKDAQAGLIIPTGSLSTAKTATAILLRIQPIGPPARLPHSSLLDGNAYKIDATALPVRGAVTISQPVLLTLEWPHGPSGILQYRGKRWHTLCTADRAVLTSITIACRMKALGIVAVVHTPGAGAKGQPAQSRDSSRSILPVVSSRARLISASS